nr:MAG TPA: hypothetical protein [Caudoviricetes sp.]
MVLKQLPDRSRQLSHCLKKHLLLVGFHLIQSRLTFLHWKILSHSMPQVDRIQAVHGKLSSSWIQTNL